MEPSGWDRADYMLLHAVMNLISACSCLLSTSAPGERMATPPPHTQMVATERSRWQSIHPSSRLVLLQCFKLISLLPGLEEGDAGERKSVIYGGTLSICSPAVVILWYFSRASQLLTATVIVSCFGQRLIICLGNSAATCFLSWFALTASWLNTHWNRLHLMGATDVARPLYSYTGTESLSLHPFFSTLLMIFFLLYYFSLHFVSSAFVFSTPCWVKMNLILYCILPAAGYVCPVWESPA